MAMGRLEFGLLSEAWTGEAADFTPLLVEQLDALGDALGVALVEVGRSEVATTGGRRIDIVGQDTEGSEFVIENQYGRADHDHLTRGLAYAVARRARGLVVIAEQHRDEFRAVAQYLNEMAEHDPDRGIAVWLVEARAVRIGDSPWAPLFTPVEEPNTFTASIEGAKAVERPGSLDEFLAMVDDRGVRASARSLIDSWLEDGHRIRLERTHVVLEARGPATSGIRTVVALYHDGHVMVPYGSYAGLNTGISIEPLTGPAFRGSWDGFFGFAGSEQLAMTTPGFLNETTCDEVLRFCRHVAEAYADALGREASGTDPFDDLIGSLDTGPT